MAAKKPAPKDPLDQVININPDDLTVREMTEVEDILGGPIEDLYREGAKRTRVAQVLALVVLRRDHPDLELDDIAEMRMGNLRLGEDDGVT